MLVALTARAGTAPRVPEGFRAGQPRSVRLVVDGDTLVLEEGERVRLLGVDAPEMRHEDPEARALGRLARAKALRLVRGRRVVLVTGEPATDTYGRTLAYAHVVDDTGALGLDLGAELLRSGSARLYPTRHPRRTEYAALQAEARAGQRGIWNERGLRALDLGPAPSIAPDEACARMGSRVRMVGVVAAAHLGPKAFHLDLHPGDVIDASAARSASSRVVMFRNEVEVPRDAELLWLGRHVAVTGKVEEYTGRAEIVVHSVEEQVEVFPF